MYRNPHFQNSKEFALNGWVIFDIFDTLTISDDSNAEGVLISNINLIIEIKTFYL